MRAFAQTKLVKPDVIVHRIIKAPVLAKAKTVGLAKLNLKIGVEDDEKDEHDNTPLPIINQAEIVKK